MFLENFVLINVHEENFAKELWEKLGEYQAKSLLNQSFLKNKFYSLRMEEGGWITNNLEGFNMVVAQLAYVGVKIKEEEKC